jgi:hypothetical protein
MMTMPLQKESQLLRLKHEKTKAKAQYKFNFG